MSAPAFPLSPSHGLGAAGGPARAELYPASPPTGGTAPRRRELLFHCPVRTFPFVRVGHDIGLTVKCRGTSLNKEVGEEGGIHRGSGAWEAEHNARRKVIVSVAEEICRSDEKKSVAAGMRHRMLWWGKHSKRSRRRCGEWLPCGTTLALSDAVRL